MLQLKTLLTGAALSGAMAVTGAVAQDELAGLSTEEQAAISIAHDFNTCMTNVDMTAYETATAEFETAMDTYYSAMRAQMQLWNDFLETSGFGQQLKESSMLQREAKGFMDGVVLENEYAAIQDLARDQFYAQTTVTEAVAPKMSDYFSGVSPAELCRDQAYESSFDAYNSMDTAYLDYYLSAAKNKLGAQTYLDLTNAP